MRTYNQICNTIFIRIYNKNNFFYINKIIFFFYYDESSRSLLYVKLNETIRQTRDNIIMKEERRNEENDLFYKI